LGYLHAYIFESCRIISMVQKPPIGGNNAEQPEVPEIQRGAQAERTVRLVKDRSTGNRFYVYVAGPDYREGLEADVPKDMRVGVAYPLFEDAGNKVMVPISAFNTLEAMCLGPDDPLCREIKDDMIHGSMGPIVHMISDIMDRSAAGNLHFMGTDMGSWRDTVVRMAANGVPRRTLDDTTKTGGLFEGANDFTPYYYKFDPSTDVEALRAMDPPKFIQATLGDFITTVQNRSNYADVATYKVNVAQKFMALLFSHGVATASVFHGVADQDYSVSAEKDMTVTPLYVAMKSEFQRLERGLM
jgi:hypothetical protein